MGPIVAAIFCIWYMCLCMWVIRVPLMLWSEAIYTGHIAAAIVYVVYIRCGSNLTFGLNFFKSQILYEPSGPWSRRLSPVSVVLSGWESLTPPGWDTNPSQVSSQQMLGWYSFTYPGRMESWVGLSGKEGRTNIRILAEPVSNWEPCGRKADILPTAPTMPVKSTNQNIYLLSAGANEATNELKSLDVTIDNSRSLRNLKNILRINPMTEIWEEYNFVPVENLTCWSKIRYFHFHHDISVTNAFS